MTIWVCIFVVFLVRRNGMRKVEMIELTNQDVAKKQSEQELSTNSNNQ